MRMRIRSPTYGREKKKTTSPEDFTSKDYERRSQNRSKTSRQKAACFSFGFCRLLQIEEIRSQALVAEAINDVPEFLLDQIGKMRKCYDVPTIARAMD